MNRRIFLVFSGISLADQALSPGGAASASRAPAGRSHAHYALRIEPYKSEIARGVVVETVAYNGEGARTLLHCHQTLHMDFGFTQLMKYVG